jgi:hypothetical protein
MEFNAGLLFAQFDPKRPFLRKSCDFQGASVYSTGYFRLFARNRAEASENGREASPSFPIYEEFGKPRTLRK